MAKIDLIIVMRTLFDDFIGFNFFVEKILSQVFDSLFNRHNHLGITLLEDESSFFIFNVDGDECVFEDCIFDVDDVHGEILGNSSIFLFDFILASLILFNYMDDLLFNECF